MDKLKILCLVLFISIFTFPITGQVREVKVKKSEFRKENKPGLKEAWKNIKNGRSNVDEGKGTYRLARENYLNAYGYNPENPELNYKIGVLFLHTDDKFEAIKYLKKAYELKEDVAPDILYQLGRAYHQVLDFERAIEKYNAYKSSIPPKEISRNPEFISHVNKLIEECNNGKELVENPLRVIVNNMGENINSIYDDYYPVVTEDDSLMYFTSRRPFSPKDKRMDYDNKFSEDIYKSTKRNGKWSVAQNLEKPRNSKRNEAALAISDDLQALYMYDGKSNAGDIEVSRFKKGKWRKPKSIKGPFNTKHRETAITFSSDGKTAYFISSREKTTSGGKDIYYTYKDSKGKWIKPQNLGTVINTKYDEEGVSLSPNDSILFFSSKGHNTMGGYDVFYSVKNEIGEWSMPENIGYPINTPDDDLFYNLVKANKHAYYTSIRESGMGGKDLYKIIFLGAEKQMAMANDNEFWAFNADTIHSIFLEELELVEIDSSIILRGTITDSESGEGVRAKLELIDLDNSRIMATGVSKENGDYKIKLPDVKDYGIEITAQGYLLFLDVLDLSADKSKVIIERDFELEKVKVGDKVVLKNIFFEFAKSTLKPESYAELNNVVKLLENNPTMRIEISGHTDNVGSQKANLRLSLQRAKSVVDYLEAQGIDKDRLEAKGYGYSQPIAPNDTPEGRELNRRVEFKVLSK